MSTLPRLGPRIAFAAVVTAVFVATFALPTSHPGEALPTRMMAVAFAAAGLLATRRIEGRTLGWLLLGVAASEAFFDVSNGYAEAVLPGAVWAYWVTQWITFIPTVLMLIFLPLLFPTGRLPSPRWRWVAGSACALLVLAIAIAAFETDGEPYMTQLRGAVLGTNPVGVPALGPLSELLFAVVAFGGLLLALASLASLVIRWRRGSVIERLQIRWLAFGIAAVITMVVGIVVIGISDIPVSEFTIDVLFGVIVLIIPGSILVALTRYRLYEIDRIVSRTVSYVLVTAVVVGVYLLAVTTLTSLTSDMVGNSPLAVAASTLAAAAAFGPARRRIQGTIDRRFNRASYDAARAAEAYRARLRDQLELTTIGDDLVSTVAATVQPTSSLLWLSNPGGQR